MLLNGKEYETFWEVYEAAQDGDVIWCDFDIFDTQNSMPESEK